MKIIKQIFYIILFFILGEIAALIINYLLPNIYIPGTIFGMIFLLIILITRKLKISMVDDVATFLTSNMGFFFIPATVSLLEYFDVLKPIFIKLVLICIFSSIVSFFAIIYTVKYTIYLQKKYYEKRGN